MPNSLFMDTARLLALSAFTGAIGILLRQPLIITYIAVGIISGPEVLNWANVHGSPQLDLLAKMGISLLLFAVGLRLDLQLVKNLGPVALATGLGQVIFTSIFGYLLCLALGMSHLTSLYVAVTLTFSSTIIIVKLLSDKKEIDSLHGRISLGFLIVQDIAALLAMIALTTLGTEQGNGAAFPILLNLAKMTGFIGAIGLFMRFILPPLMHLLARSQELLLLFGITWAVILAALAGQLGLSEEVGAFLAGVSLAGSPYRETLSNRLVTLRDFLLLFFFVRLGAGLELRDLEAHIGTAAILSFFVLIGNPLIVMAIMGRMGYRKRTGFLAGLTVAQISEFSLILAALGVSLGHIQADTMALVTWVGLITIGLSTYMILYSQWLYERAAPFLRIFERKTPFRENKWNSDAVSSDVKVVIFGLGRYGTQIAHGLQHRGVPVLGVDFDPQAVKAGLGVSRFPVQFGDAEDPDIPDSLPLQDNQWAVSAIPQLDVNLGLIHSLRRYGFKGRLAVTAHHARDADKLRKEGVDLILLPFVDAAKHAVERLVV